MVEALRDGQVPLVPGDGVEVHQRLGQAAVLHGQDPLHVRVRQRGGPPVHPVGQPRRDVDRLVAPRELVLVDHARQVLVDHVVRRPDPAGLACLQPVEELFGERRQVAGGVPGQRGRPLQLREFADEVRPGRLAARIPGVRVADREAGQQVPDGVAAHQRVRAFPAAARAGGGRPPVVQPERVEHPVRVEEPQVAQVPQLVVPERGVKQPHRGQRVRGGTARRAIRRVAAGAEPVSQARADVALIARRTARPRGRRRRPRARRRPAGLAPAAW